MPSMEREPRPLAPAPIGLRTASEYAPLFSACDRVECFIIDQFPRGGLALPPMDNRFIAWATTFRALKTFDALLALADAGYGEQATMLSRTLFEDAVVAWWCVGRHAAELLELMRSHEMSIALKIQTDTPGRREFEILASVPILDEAQLRRFAEQETVDPRRATSHWTGRTMGAMVREIEDKFTPSDATVLRRLFDGWYLLTNLVVHHSTVSTGFSLVAKGSSDGQDFNVFSRKPRKTFVHDALTVAYHSLSLLARLIATPSAAESLDSLLAEDRPRFIVLSPDSVVASRNSPCPCESGRKYKHCHGRPVA